MFKRDFVVNKAVRLSGSSIERICCSRAVNRASATPVPRFSFFSLRYTGASRNDGNARRRASRDFARGRRAMFLGQPHFKRILSMYAKAGSARQLHIQRGRAITCVHRHIALPIPYIVI